jgi:uncharacterized protein (DUF342 family)
MVDKSEMTSDKIIQRFDITVRKDGVFLTVKPPDEKGRKADILQVKREIAEKHIVHVNFNIVEMALIDASGRSVKIAEYDSSVYHDGRGDIRITQDGLKAYLTLIPAHCGRETSFDNILKTCELKNFVIGVKREVIRDMVNNKIFNQEMLIAEGIPPVNGVNGRVDFKFELKDDILKPQENDDGSVDFRELNLIINATKGELLAEKIPPTPGKEGRRITGELIPPKPGREVLLQAGANTVLSEDRNKLYSVIDGQVLKTGKGVKVVPIYEVKGDVDFSVGNIDFVGSVFIRGRVLDGFTVRAQDDIIIAGNVEAAVLKAGGDIKIKSGVVGKEKAYIEADGNIYAKFFEMATVRCAGTIFVGKAILHSNCTAGDSIIIKGNKTNLIGGIARAGFLVESDVIGSPLSAKTYLEVGVDPSLLESIKKVSEELRNHHSNLKLLEQAVNTLHKQKKFAPLSPQKEQLLLKSENTIAQIHQEINRLTYEEQELNEKISECKDGEVRALHVIYPGTKVTIATAVRYIKEPLKHCSLIFKDGEVTVEQLLHVSEEIKQDD